MPFIDNFSSQPSHQIQPNLLLGPPTDLDGFEDTQVTCLQTISRLPTQAFLPFSCTFLQDQDLQPSTTIAWPGAAKPMAHWESWNPSGILPHCTDALLQKMQLRRSVQSICPPIDQVTSGVKDSQKSGHQCGSCGCLRILDEDG